MRQKAPITPVPGLSDAKAAKLIGVSVSTLRRGIERGDAPPYYVIGARRRWSAAEVQEWIASRRVDPAGENGKRAGRDAPGDQEEGQ